MQILPNGALSFGDYILDYVLDEKRLRQRFPWFRSFEKYMNEQREMIREVAIPGKYNQDALGFSPSRQMRVKWEMPDVIRAAVDAVDPEILGRPPGFPCNEKKLDRFLKKHPVYDLRVKRV